MRKGAGRTDCNALIVSGVSTAMLTFVSHLRGAKIAPRGTAPVYFETTPVVSQADFNGERVSTSQVGLLATWFFYAPWFRPGGF
jgi:hypothetical protein